ncbi:MAG: Replication factor A protein 1 [Cirrosporium novae-zelandiae]|nr:MAG: Replication factor A protein 1 [Cirrosporium novae-zelandiae]
MASDPASHVSQGSLAAIFDGGNIVAQPILQCLQIKPLAGQGGNPERYRVVFSDIQNYVQSMLATQANHIMHQGKLRKGCFVRIKQFQANAVKGKKIIIVLDLEVLEELGESEKLGDPQGLEVKHEDDNKQQTTSISANGFYGNKPQQPIKQQQSTGQSLPSRPNNSSAGGHGTIYPIEGISPYAHKWTIKARCVFKSDIKTWHNRNGEGKLFNVNLLDETGEIRATGFNDQCDSLYDVFQEGGVYYISSPCQVQFAKKQFSTINNDYEINFGRDTIVEKAEEQDGIPQVRFNFTPIGDLQTIEKDSTIDIIGVLQSVDEVSQIVSKATSKPYDKRELTLVDNTGFSVRLTIWGNTATQFEVPINSIIAFKGVRVSDFNGRSLSLLSSGTMTVDPDIDEAHKLKGWYDAAGHSETFTSYASTADSTSAATGRLDPLKTIAQVREENLGMTEEKTDYFTLKATIIYVKQDSVTYPACLSETCNKKVIELDPGQWRCESCSVTHPHPQYRYMMSVNVSDHTGQLWLSCFDSVGRLIMGMNAEELTSLKENDEAKASEAFQEANCRTWVFKCSARMDNFNDNQRVRYQVRGASGVDFASGGRRLNELIQGYFIQ